MRFGYLRGVMLAVALVSSMAATARSASADGFHDTIPRESWPATWQHGRALLRPARSPGATTPRTVSSTITTPSRATCGICGLLGKGCRPAAAVTACSATAARAAARRVAGIAARAATASKAGTAATTQAAASSRLRRRAACGDPGCGRVAAGHGHGRRIKDCGLCKGQGLRPLPVQLRRRLRSS